jgi:hypothetical protein
LESDYAVKRNEFPCCYLVSYYLFLTLFALVSQVEEEISEFGYHPDVHPQAIASHATSEVIAEAVVI